MPIVRCDSCSKAFNARSSLLQHIKDKHKIDLRRTEQEEEYEHKLKMDAYFREDDIYRIDEWYRINRERDPPGTDALKEVVKCNLCPNVFYKLSSLVQHVQDKHKMNMRCKECKKVLSPNEADYHNHIPQSMPRIVGYTPIKPTHIPIIKADTKSRKQIGKTCYVCGIRSAMEDNGGLCDVCKPFKSCSRYGGYSIHG